MLTSAIDVNNARGNMVRSVVAETFKHDELLMIYFYIFCFLFASKKAIYDIGTEILNVHCFCTMEMILFSKSIIPDENSVKISRRIFLDRSQGLKCTKKTSFFSKICMRPWISRLCLPLIFAPGGRLGNDAKRRHTYNTRLKPWIKRKSLNLVYLNKLIDYSMVFPFYQGLNPLLNGKSNKDVPLSCGRSILARGSRGPGPGPWAPARQNASTNW